MQNINITINGRPVEAKIGQTVLQAALNAEIYIPHLCHHPDLPPQGGCKLCVVEIEGLEGAVTSCNTEAKEGMVIRTNTDNLARIRGLALELMLASHPADCTSCPVYLNCELQAVTQYLGAVHSRLRRIEKKTARLNSVNPLIVRDMERCTQCGRCIRVCSEVRGVGILQYNRKDGEIYVGTASDHPLREANCRFCGACIEVCPTGALRDAQGVFSREPAREKALIPCRDTCPAHTDIPAYVRYVAQGKYSEAVAIIREKAPFPLTLGHVCNHKCEAACRHEKLNSPLSIRSLKRAAVENDREEIWKQKAKGKMPASGMKVAIIGAGPSGLTAAYYLVRKGHSVTIYEKLPVAGGMLAAGIPEYRLPREVIAKETGFIQEAGVEIIINTEIKSAAQLKNQGYHAVLIAIGAHQGRKPDVAGAGKAGVYTAVDFLRKVSLKEVVEIGEQVAVIGGGNVAFDCARTAVRLGVKNVAIFCLEAREGMLADPEEIVQGEEEGIIIHNNKATLAIEGTPDRPAGIRHIDVKKFIFAFDGRLEIEAVEGSEKISPADTVIFAAGQVPQIFPSFGVELGTGNRVCVDSDTLATKVEGVFAAGDAIYGTKSVIEAVASGRKAAESIDKYLGGSGDIGERLIERQELNGKIGMIEGFANQEREANSVMDTFRRISCFDEVDLGLSKEQAVREAGRCLQCDLRADLSRARLWGDYKYR